MKAQARRSPATDLETKFCVQCLLQSASLIWAFLSHTKPFLALQGVLSSFVSFTLPEALSFLTPHMALRLSLLSPYTERKPRVFPVSQTQLSLSLNQYFVYPSSTVCLFISPCFSLCIFNLFHLNWDTFLYIACPFQHYLDPWPL